IVVGIGPAICPKCFAVGKEVARQFDPSVVQESEEQEGVFHVDLWQANVLQCIEAGIPERNIEVMRVCTVEDHSLYSFRRGDRIKRNITFIRRTI
ncbi:MAG TPA: laccase domain-containing protein, partial [Patescibacteria group bacterium]|nr:laccase domain-containing protein [Patescibacteria group bacterium]